MSEVWVLSRAGARNHAVADLALHEVKVGVIWKASSTFGDMSLEIANLEKMIMEMLFWKLPI